MTNKISVTAGTLATLFFLVAVTFAFSVYADTRGSVDRAREVGRNLPTPPLPSPPAPTHTPPTPPAGGISSVTSGTVSTGGNTGGTVTTGDEHVEVIEINIGPTNPPPLPPQDDEDEGITPSASESSCDSRSRSGCAVPTSERTR